MTKKTTNIIRGVGSLVDIMPDQTGDGYSRFVPKGSPSERMGATWERVGQSIRRATGKYQSERKA